MERNIVVDIVLRKEFFFQKTLEKCFHEFGNNLMKQIPLIIRFLAQIKRKSRLESQKNQEQNQENCKDECLNFRGSREKFRNVVPTR